MNHWSRWLKDSVQKMCKVILTISFYDVPAVFAHTEFLDTSLGIVIVQRNLRLC